MNIFVLDSDPKIAAQMHCDRHVVKMIVESAQMLCTAHHVMGTHKDFMYKSTHINHPCNKWVRESQQNYKWLLDLAYYLVKEYEYRYNKNHKTEEVIAKLIGYSGDFSLPDVKLTPFALAMPPECKLSDPVESYRNYYIKEKQHLAKWTKREIPSWFKFIQ